MPAPDLSFARADGSRAAATDAASPLPAAAHAADLRAFVEQLPAAAAMFDRGRQCLASSRQFRDTYGELNGVLDEPVMLRRWPEWRDAFDRALAGETVSAEVAWRDPTGVDQWTSWVLQPWNDGSGAIRGVLAFCQLVTARKQAELDLRQAYDSVEEMNHQLESAIARANGLAIEAAVADQAKSAFLAMMSHEIRTPLTGVIGMANILEHTSLGEDQRDYLRTIRISGEALLGVINDMLDYSKIEAGHLELEDEDFDLRTCVEEALELLAGAAFAKQLELAAVWADDVPQRVRGDVTRLRQILINLVGNAVKFTERGEVVVEVQRVRGRGALAPGVRCQLEIAVRDTGPGIAEEQQHRLFQVFSQLDRSTTRTHGGTGLGLAISRRLAELMGGRMWVESQAGHGATFRFTFDTAAVALRPAPTVEPCLQGRRILLVDDNAINRGLMLEAVKGTGMIADTAADFAGAIEQLRSGGGYDAVVIDEILPDRNGFELPDALEPAQRPRWSIGYSLLNGGANRNGLDVVLKKPVKPDTLLRALRQGFGGGAGVATGLAPAADLRETARRAPLNILLVEDNPVNQRVALLMLESLGYHATAMSDGAAAVAACREQAFDVVLLDVQMPVMDGLEAARHIRTRSGSPARPWIVALTAGAFKSDRERALAAGMNDFVTKPILFDGLQMALARAHAALHDRADSTAA